MIILDTHVLIWFADGSDKLGNDARVQIDLEADKGEVGVAAITCWEVALLEHRRAVDFGRDAKDWLADALAIDGFRLLPLTGEIAFETVRMNWTHRDPADRMIVATARSLDARLLTADGEILEFGAQGALRAIDARI